MAGRRNPVKKVLRLVPRAIRKTAHWGIRKKQRAQWRIINEAREKQVEPKKLLKITEAEVDRLVDELQRTPMGKNYDRLVVDFKNVTQRIAKLKQSVQPQAEIEEKARQEWRRQRTAGLPGVMRRVAAGTRLRTGRRMVDYADTREMHALMGDLLDLAQRSRRRKQ